MTSDTKQTINAEAQEQGISPQLKKELGCVATAVYYESRGESEKGQWAVARVIQNRVRYNFGATACDVVHQKIGGRCQFTWACTKYRIITPDVCASCWQAATQVFVENLHQDLVKDALYFETGKRTNWRNMVLVGKIGHHNFYKKTTNRTKRCK